MSWAVMVAVRFCPAWTLSGTDNANLLVPSRADLTVKYVTAEFTFGVEAAIAAVPAVVSL